MWPWSYNILLRSRKYLILNCIWKHKTPRITKKSELKENKQTNKNWRQYNSWFQHTLLGSHNPNSLLPAQYRHVANETQQKPLKLIPASTTKSSLTNRLKSVLAETSLLNKWNWQKWISTCSILKQKSYLTHHTKINSFGIKDTHLRPEAIKLLEENATRHRHRRRFLG